MNNDPLPALPDTPFWRAFQGRFAGFPTWPMFDRFWSVLETSGGDWFILDLEKGELPQAPASADAFAGLLNDVQEMYAPARSRSFSGVAFVDNVDEPKFVKLFDPWNMGASCGSSGERVMPRYVLSRMAPDMLPEAPSDAHSPEPKGFLARLAGRS